MSIKSSGTGPSLLSLSVKGFRGLEDLSISRLGRVTLFAGKNGVGKTTLLETIRLYAARCNYPVVESILNGREEFSPAVDEDGDEVFALDWDALFHGRRISTDAQISIGPKDDTHQQLNIRIISLTEKEIRQSDYHISDFRSPDETQALEVEFGGEKNEYPLTYHRRPRWPYKRTPNGISRFPPEVRCESLGPGLMDNSHVARLWDRVALTEAENQAVQALNLISGNKVEVERIAIIGDERSPRYNQRRIVVKVKDQKHPVPLKSLGDGATRLFGTALALANSRDGYLVIDEVENGIHYSVQRDFWNMVLKTAHENRVQVFATTHSWDCVAGFAHAATALNEVEGTLIRLDRSDDQIQAVEYSEEELGVAAKQRIEVR